VLCLIELLLMLSFPGIDHGLVVTLDGVVDAEGLKLRQLRLDLFTVIELGGRRRVQNPAHAQPRDGASRVIGVLDSAVQVEMTSLPVLKEGDIHAWLVWIRVVWIEGEGGHHECKGVVRVVHRRTAERGVLGPERGVGSRWGAAKQQR
jgi:hypothetical protein